MKKVVICVFSFLLFGLVAVKPALAYAPNVTGKVTQNTDAPISGVWIQWDSYEAGDAGNNANKGDHNRYSGTDSKGKFSFKGWDSEGIENSGGQVYSNVGKREYNEKINLDYDDSNGKEARRSDTNLYDIFNCHNELNSFSLKLPSSMAGAKVKVRWRRDSNNTAWSEWADNKISLPKDDFSNSHDYEVQFNIDLPKKASIRDLDTEIKTSQVQAINSKVPACLKVDLCADGNKNCSAAVKSAPGIHRVVLSGVGELQRKLTIGNASKPIWVVECVQRGTPENPQYMCTTGNSKLDNEVFKKDNFSTLKNELGYSSHIYYSDGTTETSAKITDANRQDVYEWETRIALGKKLVSVFMAMYESENTLPPQSGNQPSQIQATLSNEDGCRLIVDPYGRVYDSYTFEPLAQTAVTLSKKGTDGTFTKVQQSDVIANLTNPITTAADGKFSFIVPPGTYRLNAEKKDYKPYQSADIVQDAQPQNVNIPLDPLDKTKAAAAAARTNISVTSIFQKVMKTAQALRIEGVASHPQAIVTVYSQQWSNGKYVRSEKLASTVADIDGTFTLQFPLASIPAHEIVGELEVAKKFDPSTTAVVQLEPLLSEVSGFAVNDAGTPVSGGTVGLYLLNSNVPVAEVKADARGYFTIPSTMVPEIAYTIRSGTSQLKPRAFMALNAKLGSSNNVYAQARPANQNVLGASSEEKPPLSSTGIIGVVLTIFIFTVAALLGVYILQQPKKKRRYH